MKSSAAISARASAAASVRNSSVPMLPDARTRSKTCIMYRDEVSIRILMTRLKAAIHSNGRRQRERATVKSLSHGMFGRPRTGLNAGMAEEIGFRRTDPPERGGSGCVPDPPSLQRQVRDLQAHASDDVDSISSIVFIYVVQ